MVERTLGSVATLFSQYVAGYVGRSMERRSDGADADAVWSMVELQELLDEWIVTVWQNHPHDGLRDPVSPGTAPTPNDKYAALVAVAGYVPVVLSADDYIELLPVTWRVINSYSIKINQRSYDSPALNPYRRQHSGMEAKRGLWEVHHDPYDVSRIWVRNHHDGGWITATWTHLCTTPTAFGELAWQHARRVLAERGNDAATEQEIAEAAAALLDEAERGPAGAADRPAKDRRVAGRTRATTAPSRPAPAPQPEQQPEAGAGDPHRNTDTADHAGGDGPVVKVIPLPVFDARKEAENWWKAIASRIASTQAGTVSPTATTPGRSGHQAP